MAEVREAQRSFTHAFVHGRGGRDRNWRLATQVGFDCQFLYLGSKLLKVALAPYFNQEFENLYVQSLVSGRF